MKLCRKCHERKPLSEFYEYFDPRRLRVQTRHACMACVRAANLANYWHRAEHYRATARARYHRARAVTEQEARSR